MKVCFKIFEDEDHHSYYAFGRNDMRFLGYSYDAFGELVTDIWFESELVFIRRMKQRMWK